jgi:hypothetical protein
VVVVVVVVVAAAAAAAAAVVAVVHRPVPVHSLISAGLQFLFSIILQRIYFTTAEKITVTNYQLVCV